MNHHRDEKRFSQQMEVKFRKRKQLCANWVKYADRQMSEEIAKKHKVSIRACIAVLGAVNKCSFTGDFCNARQKRIAEVARYSVRTVVSAIRALSAMGILFVKHQYKGEGKERRRVASFTIIKAFRNKFETMKDLISSGLSASAITKKLMGHSVSAMVASQIKAFNKVTAKFRLIDLSDGVIKPLQEGIRDIATDYNCQIEGVGL